jgi:hypothetical protein
MEVALKPGDGPFRAKGLVYRGMLEYYDRSVRGGRAAVLAALDDEHRAFCGQSFLASAMYDVLPMTPLSVAAAKLNGQRQVDLVRDTARFIAHRDINTFFKLLLRLTSVETVALSLPKVGNRYFDFGEASGRLVSPGRTEVYQWGIPQVAAESMVPAFETFTHVALQLAGARDLRVRASPPVPDGERFGLVTVSVRWVCEWTER